MRIKRHQSWRTENNILMEVLQVILPQFQLYAQGLEPCRLFPHLLFCTFIAGGHIAAVGAEQLDQRGIADADSDDCYGFIVKGLNIFV